MSKSLIVIYCCSSDSKLQKHLKSIVHVLNLVGGLKQNWVYGEDNIDVHVTDMDDNEQKISPNKSIVIAVSSNPELLFGQKYSLTKPLRNQALQEILKRIESSEPVTTPKLKAVHDTVIDTQSRPTLEAVVSTHALTEPKEMLYRLQAWPDLSLMSEDMMLDAARVSALLAVKPASLSFISSFLDTPKTRLEDILSVIDSCAHPDYPCLAKSPMLSDVSHGDTVAESKVVAKPSSILSKLWNRLKGAA